MHGETEPYSYKFKATKLERVLVALSRFNECNICFHIAGTSRLRQGVKLEPGVSCFQCALEDSQSGITDIAQHSVDLTSALQVSASAQRSIRTPGEHEC